MIEAGSRLKCVSVRAHDRFRLQAPNGKWGSRDATERKEYFDYHYLDYRYQVL
jgi:hypothetical protein